MDVLSYREEEAGKTWNCWIEGGDGDSLWASAGKKCPIAVIDE